jgi:2-polyprenyl-3-methyl-5-hydroxy-6-metoxy-1,4-benzoquinol methylase
MWHETMDHFAVRTAPRDLPELMDGDGGYDEFRACLSSLEQVNRWSLGYRPTLSWLSHLPRPSRAGLHIVDVGCGGGDLLRRIAAWSRREGRTVRLTGIDVNTYAARAAAESTPSALGITWATCDALHYQPEHPVDIIVSSLTTHHLENEQIIALLRWMETTARAGWFINDLERSERSARAFAWLAKTMGWHRFVQHDGPVSFRRAFRREDWEQLLALAEIPAETFTIERWRPGRLCVGRWK